MNYWWIIRSPILLAVVVISSKLCVCVSCVSPPAKSEKKKSDLASNNVQHTTSVIHQLQRAGCSFQAHVAKTTPSPKGFGIKVRIPLCRGHDPEPLYKLAQVRPLI